MNKMIIADRENRENLLEDFNNKKRVDDLVDKLLNNWLKKDREDYIRYQIKNKTDKYFPEWGSENEADNVALDEYEKTLRKRRMAKREELEDLVKTSIELEDSNADNTYKKGLITHKYKKNSRAADMKKSRDKNKRPANISVDYTEELFDLEYPLDKRGRKIRNSKPIKKVYNQDKAELLIFKLDYQTKIKYTVLHFFDVDGNEYETDNIDGIKDFVLNGTIDLSKGIYANQKHHLDISRNEVRFCNYSDIGCYNNAYNRMSKRDYMMIYYSKNTNEKKKIYSVYDLHKIKDEIDWDKKVLIVEKNPEKKNSSRWNDKYNGYWLMISKLSTPKQVDEFKVKHCVEKPIKNCVLIKTLIDFYAIELDFDKEVFDKKVKSYDTFSYKRCNKLLQTGKIMKNIAKYYSKYIKHNFRDFLHQIERFTYLKGKLFKDNCKTFLYSLSINLAKTLDIDISEKDYKLMLNDIKRAHNHIENIDYFDSEQVLFRLNNDTRYKPTPYVKYLTDIDIDSALRR